MRFSDLLTICFRNLTRRKVRTLLTVVGVVVGTCSIVVMISIGIGMSAALDAQLAQMGDLTLIDIYNWGSEDVTLTDEVMEEIIAMDHVVVATPFYDPYELDIQIYAGNQNRYSSWPNIIGIYPEALSLLGYQFIEGDPMTALSEPFSVVMGQYAAYNFRDTKKRPGYDRVDPYPDATGEIPEPLFDIFEEPINVVTGTRHETADELEFEFEVTGHLVEDWSKGYQTSRGMFMSIDDLKEIQAEYNKENRITPSDEETGYTEAKVKVSDIEYVEEVQTAIDDMGFETYSMETIRKPLEESAQQQQLVLGSLGAISLFVAAIGITNTMVMSIYERTREIGVMKVVGCYVADIRTIFLVEAGIIGLLGGIVGVGLSYFISFLMNTFGFSMSFDNPFGMSGGTGTDVSIIPLWLVGAALVFATLIGLISGYYPANRAVKISALSAIKQD